MLIVVAKFHIFSYVLGYVQASYTNAAGQNIPAAAILLKDENPHNTVIWVQNDGHGQTYQNSEYRGRDHARPMGHWQGFGEPNDEIGPTRAIEWGLTPVDVPEPLSTGSTENKKGGEQMKK